MLTERINSHLALTIELMGTQHEIEQKKYLDKKIKQLKKIFTNWHQNFVCVSFPDIRFTKSSSISKFYMLNLMYLKLINI